LLLVEATQDVVDVDSFRLCAFSDVTRALWMLEELSIPYRHVSIGKGPEGIASDDFLKLNPHARLPTLVDGDLVVWESMAINLYLAKRYGGALGPGNIGEEAHVTMWSIWAVSSLEMPSHEIYFHTLREPPVASGDRVSPASLRTPPSAARHGSRAPRVVTDRSAGARRRPTSSCKCHWARS
jgi:glutathione S-transferase